MNYNINTQAITFWNFLTENKIEIPIIQRDYAQGRLGKEILRKTFLSDLKKALDSEETMKLDFVYGAKNNGKLNPLDGQQRLTTLWLLHWYIALRAGKLYEKNCEIFQNFTYETRISSREFCQNLCDCNKFSNYDGNDIVSFITMQTWFYSAWKQDPTIQSMLRMLGGTKIVDKKEDIEDGIEEILQDTDQLTFEQYWQRLTEKETIVFYNLPLQNFGLSDDLYIKMNARGKQLTSFENFKADMIGYITKQSENVSLSNKAEWDNLLDPMNGFPIKLDTDWTDIFWKNKSKGVTDNESKTRKSNQIDEIYFAFLNRFFWNELFIAKNSENKYLLDIGKGDESSTQESNNSFYNYLNNSEHDNDNTIAYKGLEFYKYDNGKIPLTFFKKIKRVLDNYYIYSQEKDLPECTWNTSFRFIPRYTVENENNIEITNNANEKILSVTTLNQVQRIVFFAICKYFDHDNIICDNESSLQQWMRVVWNLVSGEDSNGRPEIRSTSSMRTAIEFINSLDSHNVYDSLVEMNVSGTTAFEERCKEEIAKAKQILKGSPRHDGKTWEKIISEAEQYEFFKGSIRFLFTDSEGKIYWYDFDEKWTNAQKFFPKYHPENYFNTVECAKYFNDEKVKELWLNYRFDKKGISWRMLLQSKNFKQIHDFLLAVHVDNTELIEDIKNLTIRFNTSLWIRKWNTENCFLTNYDKQVAKPEKGFVYMVGNRERNDAIRAIINIADKDSIKFQGGNAESYCEKIDNIYYYRGLCVDFKYKYNCFRLWENNTICQMNDNWEDKIYKKDNVTGEKEYNYFPINNKNIEKIEEELNMLIEKSN